MITNIYGHDRSDYLLFGKRIRSIRIPHAPKVQHGNRGNIPNGAIIIFSLVLLYHLLLTLSSLGASKSSFRSDVITSVSVRPVLVITALLFLLAKFTGQENTLIGNTID